MEQKITLSDCGLLPMASCNKLAYGLATPQLKVPYARTAVNTAQSGHCHDRSMQAKASCTPLATSLACSTVSVKNALGLVQEQQAAHTGQCYLVLGMQQ